MSEDHESPSASNFCGGASIRARVQRVLVTGGAGFVGSHLCERLLAGGAEVICLDNFFTSDRQNVAELMANPRFEVVRHDANQPIAIEVDEIYHLACPASPRALPA